jgi:hypothetical protein
VGDNVRVFDSHQAENVTAREQMNMQVQWNPVFAIVFGVLLWAATFALAELCVGVVSFWWVRRSTSEDLLGVAIFFSVLPHFHLAASLRRLLLLDDALVTCAKTGDLVLYAFSLPTQANRVRVGSLSVRIANAMESQQSEQRECLSEAKSRGLTVAELTLRFLQGYEAPE